MKRYFLEKYNTIKLLDQNGNIIGSNLILKDGMFFEYERMGSAIHFTLDDGNTNLIMFPYKILIYRSALDDIHCYEIEVNSEVSENGN